MSFHVLLTIILFSKKIQGNFTLILPWKKIETTKAAANYITQYQINLAKQKRATLLFGTQQSFFCTEIIKKLYFPALLNHDYTLSFQYTWLLNYLIITFFIIAACIKRKICWKMFWELCLLSWFVEFSFQ